MFFWSVLKRRVLESVWFFIGDLPMCTFLYQSIPTDCLTLVVETVVNFDLYLLTWNYILIVPIHLTDGIILNQYEPC